MRIGIDIDWTLIKNPYALTGSFNKQFVKKYCHRKDLKHNKKLFQQLNDDTLQKIYAEEYFEYYKNNIYKIKPRKNAIKIIRKLKSEGNKIYFISARKDDIFKNALELSKLFLDLNEVPYNNIYCNIENKGTFCKQNNIDILIDDSIKQCLFMKDENLLQIRLKRKKRINKTLINCNNWLQIYKTIQKISNPFFTSDTHFSSDRTLNSSLRPFTNKRQMDNKIIKNINKKVSKRDIIYHLGDFGNYNMIKKIKGKVILIMGNYENEDLKNKFDNNFEQFKSYLISLGFYNIIKKDHVLKIDKYKFYLTHKPLDCDPNYFNLFGHIHEKCMCKDFGLNVGIDCHHFSPIGLNQLLFYKNWIENLAKNQTFCSKNDLSSVNKI